MKPIRLFQLIILHPLPSGKKLALAFSSAAAYALVFAPLYRLVGDNAAALTIIPVIVAACLAGVYGGVVAAFLGILLNVFLFSQVGRSGWQAVGTHWPEEVACVIVGALVGWLSEQLVQVTTRSERLATEREILNRKQLLGEEALRLTQFTIDQAAEGIAWVAPDSSFWYVNDAMCRMFGLSKDSLLVKTVHDLGLALPRERWHEVWASVREGAPTTIEVLCRREDGSSFQAEITAGYLEYQEWCFHVLFFREITERKKAEEACTASEQMYRAIFEATGTATIIVEEDTAIVVANHEFEKLSGYSRGMIEGEMSWREFVADGDDERLLAYHRQRRVDPAAAPRNYEFLFVDREERVRNVLATSTMIPGTRRSVLSLQDVTVLKEAKREIRDYADKLGALSRCLLVAQEKERRHIAHELHDEIGQALTAVKIRLQAMERCTDTQSLSQRIKEGIGIVDEQLQRVRNLSLELRPSVLDDLGLGPALRWLLTRHGNEGFPAVRLNPDIPVCRFPTEIETTCFRVAQEALTNALRHANATQISVGLRHLPNVLQLMVTDDGAGFDVAAIQERFVLGESIGLLGMQERTVLAGGSFWIASRHGGGTEIRATFPLCDG